MESTGSMKVGHSISESGVLQIRHRRSRIGPERNLIAAALSSDFFLKRHTPAVLFHEPELPTGLPDLVAVVLNAGGGAINWHRSRLKERHIRVLHYLHALRRSSRDKIAADLRMSRKQVSTVVEDLARAGLITVTAKGIRPRGLGHVFGAQAIIAIEAKIGDWSRALEQAAANHWFASHSYILIPPIYAVSVKLHRRFPAP